MPELESTPARGGWGLNTWHETPTDCEWCPEVLIGDEGVVGIGSDGRVVTAHRRCWREHFARKTDDA